MASVGDRVGGLRQTKHLYMFRWELEEAPWRRAAQPVPVNAPPPEVEMRWLSAAEWAASPALLPTPARRVEERFAGGGRCLVMRRRDSGELVYHVWLSTSAAWTDWIGGRVAPPGGYALVFDAWAHPAWRAGRLHIPGATEITRALDELDLPGAVAGVEEREIVLYARMYARAGLGYIAPYEVIVWHRLGPLSWHRRARPGAHLVEGCAAIRRRHEEP